MNSAFVSRFLTLPRPSHTRTCRGLLEPHPLTTHRLWTLDFGRWTRSNRRNRPMTKHHVVFQPSGKRGLVAEGKTLQEAARELGVEIESICGGKATCGKCAVRVEEEHFDRLGFLSSLHHLSPVSEAEARYLQRRGLAGNYRLGCTARVLGPVLVFVPEESTAARQIVRKSATART